MLLQKGTIYIMTMSQFYDMQTALYVCDRIGEVEKIIESFTEVIQDPKEDFMDFLQRLTLAVNKMI